MSRHTFPQNKCVLITGVSSGIGYAISKDLILRGWHVFGSVRNQEDCKRLQLELGSNFTAIQFDVTKPAEIKSAVIQVTKILNGRYLDALINNAGIAIGGPLLHITPEDLCLQMNVNVIGVMSVIQAFFPLLRKDCEKLNHNARIINISAVSGRIVYPFFGPYASSKHALEALSDALRRELSIYGIKVVVIQPGTIKTPIWEKSINIENGRFINTDYIKSLNLLQAKMQQKVANAIPMQRLSKTIHRALTSAHPRTRYALPSKRFSGWLLPRCLPDAWFDRVILARIGLRPRVYNPVNNASKK